MRYCEFFYTFFQGSGCVPTNTSSMRECDLADRRMKDEHDIAQLLFRWAHARDYDEWDTLAGCFHAEATIHIGWISGPASDYVARSRTAKTRAPGSARQAHRLRAADRSGGRPRILDLPRDAPRPAQGRRRRGRYRKLHALLRSAASGNPAAGRSSSAPASTRRTGSRRGRSRRFSGRLLGRHRPRHVPARRSASCALPRSRTAASRTPTSSACNSPEEGRALR